MPLILGAIGLGLGAAGTGGSLYSQNEAKKAAKKAEKENRRMAAWNALMQAAAGGIPQNDFRASAEPQVDGGALAQLGSGVTAAGGVLAENDYKTQLIKMKQDQAKAAAAQQGISNGFESQRINLDQAKAAETARANKANENQAWANNMRQESQNMNNFERNMQNDAAENDCRAQMLQIQKERTAAIAGKPVAKTGQMSEGELVRIATGKKEEDPIAVLVAGQMGKPAPSGYKSPESARKRAIQLLKDRYGWDDQQASDLLSIDSDPMGLR